MMQMNERDRPGTTGKSPSIRNVALGLLARREHSRRELQQKLTRKLPEAVSQPAIIAVLDQLEEQGLLSDQRFAEAYVNMRVRKGYGPVRIAMELAERGIPEPLAQESLSEQDWAAVLRQAWQKRFGAPPKDFADKVRQMRFLHFRGHSGEAIRQLLGEVF